MLNHYKLIPLPQPEKISPLEKCPHLQAHFDTLKQQFSPDVFNKIYELTLNLSSDLRDKFELLLQSGKVCFQIRTVPLKPTIGSIPCEKLILKASEFLQVFSWIYQTRYIQAAELNMDPQDCPYAIYPHSRPSNPDPEYQRGYQIVSDLINAIHTRTRAFGVPHHQGAPEEGNYTLYAIPCGTSIAPVPHVDFQLHNYPDSHYENKQIVLASCYPDGAQNPPTTITCELNDPTWATIYELEELTDEEIKVVLRLRKRYTPGYFRQSIVKESPTQSGTILILDSKTVHRSPNKEDAKSYGFTDSPRIIIASDTIHPNP